MPDVYTPSQFASLAPAILARIASGFAILSAAGPPAPQTGTIALLTEDMADLETKINKAISQNGMLVLIGQPRFAQEATKDSPHSQLKCMIEIGVGENPTLWRDDTVPKPHCQDVVQFITQLLQGYKIAGYQNLHVLKGDFVPDKKRQIYQIPIESRLLLDQLSPTIPVYVPTTNGQGNIIVLPFRDAVTGEIVYLRIKDGALEVSDT